MKYPGYVMHQCDVICMFDDKGNVIPLKMRVDLGRRMPVVKIDRVIHQEVQDVLHKKFVEFRCFGEGREFELLFDVLECKWFVGR